MKGRFSWAWAQVLLVAAVALAAEAPLWASLAPTVPEIDGSSIAAGLGVLAAGTLAMRARRKK